LSLQNSPLSLVQSSFPVLQFCGNYIFLPFLERSSWFVMGSLGQCKAILTVLCRNEHATNLGHKAFAQILEIWRRKTSEITPSKNGANRLKSVCICVYIHGTQSTHEPVQSPFCLNNFTFCFATCHWPIPIDGIFRSHSYSAFLLYIISFLFVFHIFCERALSIYHTENKHWNFFPSNCQFYAWVDR
jgi:hypothetical protein